MDPQPLSNLRHHLFRPLLVTGLLRWLLGSHFQEGLVEDQALRRLIWRRDTDTTILIESWTRWRPQETGNRPSVILKQNDCAIQRVGIANRMQGNPTDRVGDPHFAYYWVGSHTLFCLGGSGGQAQVLAHEVLRELGQFAWLVQREAGLHRWQPLEYGAVAKLEEHSETFVVPVTIGYAFEDRWTLIQQAPKLSRVLLSWFD